MPEKGPEREINFLPKGALNGENNGLTLLLDAETLDYGNGFYDLGERAGEGFKVAVPHHLENQSFNRLQSMSTQFSKFLLQVKNLLTRFSCPVGSIHILDKNHRKGNIQIFSL